MCGIVGGVWASDRDPRGRLEKSLAKIQHRGPDDAGCNVYQSGNSIVGMGHARLSIIDLSAAGHQPMPYAEHRFSIVFNGEIYNYRELRSQLKGLGYHFTSDSDTEVLVASWAQWGRACLPRLVGMFAFAVLDRLTCTLTCVRDAFGIKPFFYTNEKINGFYFASEVAALLELMPSKPRLNWQRSYDYLVHGDYDSTAECFFDGIVHLLPGHLVTVDLALGVASEPVCWWIPNIQESKDADFDEAVSNVRESFLQGIRLHMRSDVPLGAALSGGVDSSAVVCAMRHVEPDLPIHTFSYIASGSDVNEEVWVDKVNRYVDAIAHKVSINAGDLERDLDEMIVAQGEPFGSTSIYAQYRVFQLARENGVTVTLDGQGADEILAGYSGYPGQRLHSLIDEGRFGEAWAFLNSWSRWPGRSRIIAVKRLIAEMTEGRVYETLRKASGMDALPSWINGTVLSDSGVQGRYPRQRSEFIQPGRHVMAELAMSLTRRGLPALLRHGDRNSMRFSIESRVPFLMVDFVDLLLSLPENYLISSNGETKHIFRAAMRGIVPDDVLDRRDKIGFSTPEKNWLLSMKDTVRGWLRADINLAFLDQSKILQEFDQIAEGRKPFSWQVWRWINFIRWHQHFLP